MTIKPFDIQCSSSYWCTGDSAVSYFNRSLPPATWLSSQKQTSPTLVTQPPALAIAGSYLRCKHVSMFNRFVTILVSWQHFRLTLSSSYSVFWTQRIMVHAAIFFAMVDCSKVFLRQKFASLLVSSYWIASKGLVVLEFTLDTFAILVFDLSYLESFSRSNLVATCSLSFVSIDFSQDTVD